MAPRILISGAGIAGAAAAYWLGKTGAEITIVERDSQLRLTGQSVDIRQSAVDIIKMMGLEEEVRQHSTGEEGVAFVDETGKRIAQFDATGNSSGQSLTSEFEIFRGALAQLLNDAIPSRVEYLFGETVKSINQHDSGVDVEFANGAPDRSFDLVIAADGQNSKLRSLALERGVREDVKSLDTYCAYFTIEEDLLKGSNHAECYNATGGRVVFLRPDAGRTTRGLLIIVCNGDRQVVDRLLQSQSANETMDIMEEYFRGAGWIVPQVLDGMRKSTDFYSSEIAQVKTDRLYKGRIALLGDAGYCPSGITGMGTSMAIIGAYILAGEVLSHPEDLPAALQGYEERLLPLAREAQRLPPGAPQIINPQTWWGIYIARSLLSFGSWIKIDKWVGKIASIAAFTGKSDSFRLPVYDWPPRLDQE